MEDRLRWCKGKREAVSTQLAGYFCLALPYGCYLLVPAAIALLCNQPVTHRSASTLSLNLHLGTLHSS